MLDYIMFFIFDYLMDDFWVHFGKHRKDAQNVAFQLAYVTKFAHNDDIETIVSR